MSLTCRRFMMAWLRRLSSHHGNHIWEQLPGELTGIRIPYLSSGRLLPASVAHVLPYSADILRKIIKAGLVECQICCYGDFKNSELKPSLLKLKAPGIDYPNNIEHGCYS